MGFGYYKYTISAILLQSPALLVALQQKTALVWNAGRTRTVATVLHRARLVLQTPLPLQDLLPWINVMTVCDKRSKKLNINTTKTTYLAWGIYGGIYCGVKIYGGVIYIYMVVFSKKNQVKPTIKTPGKVIVLVVK